MNISFKSIEKRIRKLELKLKIVLSPKERVERTDRKAFDYYHDKEAGKNPEIPEDIVCPRYMFKQRAEFYKKFVDNNKDLQEEFEYIKQKHYVYETDKGVETACYFEDSILPEENKEYHRILMKLQKYLITAEFLKEWRKEQKKYYPIF